MYLASDSGYSVSREQLRESFPPMADFMDLLFSFAAKFNAFLLTQGEVALFSALMLITPGKQRYRVCRSSNPVLSQSCLSFCTTKSSGACAAEGVQNYFVFVLALF